MSLQNLVTIPTNTSPNWGPTGKEVYERTYQRVMADGSRENWNDTVRRVVKGNLSLVPGNRILPGEEEELYDLIYNFRAIPAGRHLWMSGVEGRQFLFNCYVSGWGDRLSEHFAFTFNQLMEGGGVGSNYSDKYLSGYKVLKDVSVHIICSPDHADYQDLLLNGLLSSSYSSEYAGAHEVEDSREGWVYALTEVIDCASMFGMQAIEGDLVYDVSNIREAGRRIKTFGGTSAGPVPFAKMLLGISGILSAMSIFGVTGPLCMELDHVIATCVVSGNVRRSARMSIMHWKDPSIDWFLKCKQDGGMHWSTNISVEIDDEFIVKLRREDPEATRIYHEIVSGMLKNGEPGFWNSDLSNVGEPNEVIATNPCGEIALEAWENCNLGHINLDAFVGSNGVVDTMGMARAHKLITRFLIRATYGDISDEKTSAKNARNRRIGVGHFGYSGFLAKQKILFSQSWKNGNVRSILLSMKTAVDAEARSYSHQLRIPAPVKTTTVAPTGTIAKMPGRGEGIHPEYARYFIRRIRYSTVDEQQRAAIQQYTLEGRSIVVDPDTDNTVIVEIPTKSTLVQELEDLGIPALYLETVDEVKLVDMLEVQKMYQQLWADNAVSYTVNVPEGKYEAEEFGAILMRFLPYLKGTTIFPDKSRALSPYERITFGEYNLLRSEDAPVIDDSYDPSCASGACPVR